MWITIWKVFSDLNNGLGVLTIYANHPGKNLAHKNKNIKFYVVGERPSTKYLQINATN